jgi:hypothetical protein
MKHISSVLCGESDGWWDGGAESYDPLANIMRKKNFFITLLSPKLQIMFYL